MLLFMLLSRPFTTQAAPVIFDCQNDANNSRLTVFAVGNYQSAQVSLGKHMTNEPAVVEYHSGESAQRSEYAKILADHVLKLSWSSVKYVNIFIVGNYSNNTDDAVIGVEYMDSSKQTLAKGMFIGLTSPMNCK